MGWRLFTGIVLLCCASVLPAQEKALPFAVPPEQPAEKLPPPKIVLPAPADEAANPAPLAVFEPYILPDKPAPKVWSGGVDIGLSGADGNSTNFKVRTGINTRAEDTRNLFKLDINYSYANSGTADLENRALGKARYERLFPGSSWSSFTASELEYDEFRAFDIRLAAHTGAAYQFVKNDTVFFKGRLGAGASREIGGPSNVFKPELMIGGDFEYKITARQKLTVVADYYPTVTDWSDYRIETRINYEILIDPTWNIVLRLGLLDRYDSTPEGKLPNDIDYYATLLWKF